MSLRDPGNTSGDGSIAVGERVYGAVTASYTPNDYTLTLPAGSYNVVTEGYCNPSNATDTVLTISNDGTGAAKTDENSGSGFYAALNGLVYTEDTEVTISVGVSGAGVGDYMLTVVAID